MGSEFRKKKITRVFGFFDRDKSNNIEKKDFELASQYIATKRGWAQDDPAYKKVQESLQKIWDSLQKHADKDNDGQISLEEWVEMWEAYAKNPSTPLEWQSLYCKHIFDVQDAGGDGAIDAEEFQTVLESFGVDKTKGVEAFKKISKGKDKIVWTEFQDLWKEFFTSEDPNAAGNYIFGGTF